MSGSTAPAVTSVAGLLPTLSPRTRAELEPFFMRPADAGSWLELPSIDPAEGGSHDASHVLVPPPQRLLKVMNVMYKQSGAVCVIAAAIAIAVPAHGVAQHEQTASAAGRWLPRDTRDIGNVTAAQRAAALATADRIEQWLKQVPELAQPDGFEILPILRGGARQMGPDQKLMANSVVEYALTLMFFHPSRAIAGEGGSCVAVRVNGVQSGRMRDAQGRDIYIEAERGKPSTDPNISDGRIPHATQVYGELWNVPRERSFVDVLFVTAGELPWKPVTRETFYQASLLELEGANGEKLADFRESMKTTPYQEWMEAAAQRKRDREAALAQTALPAAEVEKMRQTMEATEREVTERLKQDEAEHRERNAEALANSFGPRDSMRAELARMTPAERNMPTYINNALDHGPVATGWRITADSVPPAWRVLTPNYDFYRARRSAVEVRSIKAHIGIGGTCLAPTIQRALWQAYHKLDWAALNQMLEQPR